MAKKSHWNLCHPDGRVIVRDRSLNAKRTRRQAMAALRDIPVSVDGEPIADFLDRGRWQIVAVDLGNGRERQQFIERLRGVGLL